MTQVIVVKSKGTKTVGTVLEAQDAIVPTNIEVEDAIVNAMNDVANIASGTKNINDPESANSSKFLKHCSSCMKLGRQPFHWVDFSDKKASEFTIKKNGQPHSQCKKCRSEQACTWQKDFRDPNYQRLYQANRRKTHKPVVALPVEDTGDMMVHIINGTSEPLPMDEKLDSIFVAYTPAEEQK